MSFEILRAVRSGNWLIDPEEAQSYFPLISDMLDRKLEGGLSSLGKEQSTPPPVQTSVLAGNVVRSNYYSDFSDPEIPKGSTAVIPVSGPILKFSSYYGGWASSARITQFVMQANANPNIANILFVFDTPGGMVYGTQTAADAISASTKPTLSFVDDGMAASAGYWLAAAAGEIWVSQKTDVVGSIGAYRSFMDASKYYEKLGVKMEEIYADQSTEKNQDYREAMKGNFKPMKEQGLNPIVDAFISAVKEYRGDRLNLKAGDPFKGATYMADEALAIGLIDKVGTIEEAIAHLQSKSNQSSNKPETSMSLKDWFAKAGDEKTVSVEASELATLKADMQAAQSNLEAAEKLTAELKASNEKLTTDLATAQAALAAAEQSRNEWKEKAEKFGKQAGATHTEPVKEKVEGGNAETVKTEAEEFVSYAHNQEAFDKLKNL